MALLGALDVLGAGAFGTLACGVFDVVPFAEIFERSGAAVAVEEHIISPGIDEAEAFVCDDFFDGSLWHVLSMY